MAASCPTVTPASRCAETSENMPGGYLFFDIEAHNAGKQYGMTPREYVRLFQYAWDDGPVNTTTDYDEMISIVESARYLIAHNGISYDLSVLYGVDSMRPLELAIQRKVVDTFVLASLVNPAPYSYTNHLGRTVYDAAKPERAKAWLSLQEQAHQLGVPGKLGNLKDLAKKYNPPKTPVRELDYSLIPLDDEDFLAYAVQDVVAVRNVYHALLRMMKSQDYPGEYVWREMLVWSINAQITRNGVLVDTVEAQRRVDELTVERDRIMDWLTAEFGMPTGSKQPWKTNEGKEAILRAFESFGIVPDGNDSWDRTEGGAPSFSGDTMIAISEGTDAEALGRAVATLQGQRSLAQLALDTTYEDGRVHPEISCLQRSGRSSVSLPGLTVWTARGPNAVEKRYFLADPGDVMVEMDFSAADARAVAAVSGDPEFAKRFEPGVDSHDLTGEIIFGPDAYWADRDSLRPVAKMCIAENELVLTDRGRVPIQDVTTDMRVWDGENFVTHLGIVYNGEREVFTYDGLTATADHIVFVWQADSIVEVPFGFAASRLLPIIKTESNGAAVRVGDSHIRGRSLHRRWQEPVRASGMSKMRHGRLGVVRESRKRAYQGVSPMLSRVTKPVSELAKQANVGRTSTVHESEESVVPKLWRSWNPFRMGHGSRCEYVGLAESRAIRATTNAGSDRHEWELRAWESTTGGHKTPEREQKPNGSFRVPPGALAVFLRHNDQVSEARVHPRTNDRSREGDCSHEGISLQPCSRKARVYDIRLAGPHNRFTVSGCLVHNCGHAMSYRVGAKKLAASVGASVAEAAEWIENYKKAYPWVTRWQDNVTREGDRGFVTNSWGRRMKVDHDRSFNQSSALIGQSSTRELLFDGLIRIALDRMDVLRWLRMTVHDAIVWSIPEGDVEWAVPYILGKMESVFDPGTPVSQPVFFPMSHGPLNAHNWFEASHE